MIKWLGKMVAEKLAGLLVFLLAFGIIVLVWQYHHRLPSWQAVARFVGGIVLWLALATLLPWATFFLVAWVQRAESNLPAAGLLLFWAAVDGALAWLISGGGAPDAGRWLAIGLAFCLGGLYNLIAANQIANRLR